MIISPPKQSPTGELLISLKPYKHEIRNEDSDGMTVKLEVPEGLLKEFDIEDESSLREIIRVGIKQIKIEKALHLFEEGKVSIAKAAELADVSLREMMLQASARGLTPGYDRKMVEEEIQ